MKILTPPDTAFTITGYGAKQCPTRTQNDYDPDTDPADRDATDPFTEVIMKAGQDYEDQVVKPLVTAAIKSHLVIDTTVKMGKVRSDRALGEARKVKLVIFEGDRSPQSLALREDLTHALLTDPGKVRILWNSRLRKWKKDGRGRVVWATRSAEPDLLYRQNVRVAKNPKWGAIDVKFHDPFEGTGKGNEWEMSPLATPFPEKSVKVERKGIVQKDDAYQLAHYHRALEFHSVAGSPIGGIIGKPEGGVTRVVWLNLNDKIYERSTTDALSMYDAAFGQRVEIAEREIERRTNPELPHLAPPVWKAECKTCPWQSVCHDRLSVSDDISLLMGVTPTKIEVHHAAGISTVGELAHLDVATAALVEAGTPVLPEAITQARAKAGQATADLVASLGLTPRESAKTLASLTATGLTSPELAKLDFTTARYAAGTKGLIKSIDQARVVDYARVQRLPFVFRVRGINELTIPRAAVEIHVDMENDEQIYLWGMLTDWKYKNNRVRRDYHPYVGWKATEEDEARVFAEFWAGLHAMIAKAQAQEGENNVLVFHYTAAEDRCMRHLAQVHEGLPGIPTLDDVNAFLASDLWVDLYPVMTNQLIWPTEDGTLKSLAKFVQFAWRDDDPSGANSVVWYQNAIDENSPTHDESRKRIIEYNEDDCRATAALLSWLKERGGVNTLGRKISKVEELDARYRPKPRRKGVSLPLS